MKATARLATVALLALGSLLVAAGIASAAQPRPGTYAGATTQPDAMPFSGRFKLTTVADAGQMRVASVVARMKMDCQGDPARVETYRLSIPAPAAKVSGTGRFTYSVQTSPTTGFTIKGRFVSATRARGTFGRSDAATGCYVGGVKWTAKLR